MAKQQTSTDKAPAESDETIARAWDLFARNVNVTGTPTVIHEKLAEKCWEAAEAFASFMNPKPKG